MGVQRLVQILSRRVIRNVNSSRTTFAQHSTKTAIAAGRAPADSVRRPVTLPGDLSKDVLFLSCESSRAEGGVCDVYVLGTDHLSQKSQTQVKDLISFLKPQVVFIESSLKDSMPLLTHENLEKAPRVDGVIPGLEFRVAYEEANKYGCEVILGDRPRQVTCARMWNQMPLWHKTKFWFYALFPPLHLSCNVGEARELIKMNRFNVLNYSMKIIMSEFPTILNALVDERDQFMSYFILYHARNSKSVVAVVGKGHLEGIQKYWKQPVGMKAIRELWEVAPPSKPLWKRLAIRLLRSSLCRNILDKKLVMYLSMILDQRNIRYSER